MFTLQELADLFGVKLRTINEWYRAGMFQIILRRTGRFSVKRLVTPGEALRLFKLKFATPGDGSETSKIYEERVRRRRVAGLAAAAKRWGKLKKQS